jgi:hypothetical protein
LFENAFERRIDVVQATSEQLAYLIGLCNEKVETTDLQ